MAVALVLCGLAQLEVWTSEPRQPGPVWVHSVGAAGTTLPLLGRRRLPLLVAVAVTVAYTGQTLITGGGTPLASTLALLLATWSLARHADLQAAIAGGLVVLTGSAAHDVRHPHVNDIDIALSLLLHAVVWSVGLGLRRREAATTAVAIEAERLRAERDTRAAAAVAAERARLARELHDVVAHSISVIAVQAGAARWVLDGAHPPVRDALVAIEQTSRDALGELRRMLRVLRADEAPADLAPPRGLADVAQLAEQVCTAGLPVTLHVEPPPSPLPAGVDLTAYRVVQEALTNVLKHAPGASVSVSIRCAAGAMEVEVVNTRGSPTPDGDRGGGHGLLGMRERVALYGGELHAGPDPDRGFVVRARLPLTGRS